MRINYTDTAPVWSTAAGALGGGFITKQKSEENCETILTNLKPLDYFKSSPEEQARSGTELQIRL